jgi:hypothetical protein
MDEHRKLAEELHLEYLKDCSGFVDIVSNALRSTASKSEKDGWNKAVEECAKVANDWHLLDRRAVGHTCVESFKLVENAIRRLIREEGK